MERFLKPGHSRKSVEIEIKEAFHDILVPFIVVMCFQVITSDLRRHSGAGTGAVFLCAKFLRVFKGKQSSNKLLGVPSVSLQGCATIRLEGLGTFLPLLSLCVWEGKHQAL